MGGGGQSSKGKVVELNRLYRSNSKTMLLSDRGFESRQAEEMLLSSETPAAAVAPTQRPSLSVPMAFPGVKRPEPEVDHSPSYSVKVENVWRYASPPPTLCLHGKHRNSFVYLSQYLTNLMHKICFTISFISCLYMFRAHVLIIRRSELHYTTSGISILKQVSGLKLLKYNSINMSI